MEIEKVKSRLQKAERFFLFLDFDGTLAPIVKTPQEAYLDSSVKKILKKISENKNFILGIISGRTIKDVKKRVGIKNILYAGNHGLEIYDKKKMHLLTGTSLKPYQQLIILMRKELEKELREIGGVIFENKRTILAVHYRKVAQEEIKILKKIVRDKVSEYVKNKVIKMGKGKKVIEIRPNLNFSKFLALKFFEKLFKRNKSDITIYIGDDLTDEEVFSKLRKKDLKIKVGRKTENSKAEHFLKDPREVKKFLEFLLKIKS